MTDATTSEVEFNRYWAGRCKNIRAELRKTELPFSDTVTRGWHIGTDPHGVQTAALESPLINITDWPSREDQFNFVSRCLSENLQHMLQSRYETFVHQVQLDYFPRPDGNPWQALYKDDLNQPRFANPFDAKPVERYSIVDVGDGRVRAEPSRAYAEAQWKDEVHVLPGWLYEAFPVPLDKSASVRPEDYRGEWRWINGQSPIDPNGDLDDPDNWGLDLSVGKFRGRIYSKCVLDTSKIIRHRVRV
jgi:hypothetical protein